MGRRSRTSANGRTTSTSMVVCYCLVLGLRLGGGLALATLSPSDNELDGNSPNHVNSKSPASHLHEEVDILKLMKVSGKEAGVSLVEGPIARYPAYKFRVGYDGGNVPLDNITSQLLTAAMRRQRQGRRREARGFTVVFVYRQQKNNLGTLVSVNSPGRLTPWFQLASNSRLGTLTLKYRLVHSADDTDTDADTNAARLRQLDFALPKHYRKSPLAAWTWMSVSVDFDTGLFRLDFDCQPSKFESLAVPAAPLHAAQPSAHASALAPNASSGGVNAATAIAIPRDALVYFRQEPGRKKKFLGSMQVAKVVPWVSQQRLWTCLKISPNLAPEFRKPLL